MNHGDRSDRSAHWPRHRPQPQRAQRNDQARLGYPTAEALKKLAIARMIAMSDPFGGGGGGCGSLTESIFGPSAADGDSSSGGGLFAKPIPPDRRKRRRGGTGENGGVATPHAVAGRSDGPSDACSEPEPTQSARKSRRRRGRTGKPPAGPRSASTEGGPRTPREILDRRRTQSKKQALDRLTISLGDYRGGDDEEELCSDVRGLMQHHGLVILRDALSDADVDLISKMADATHGKVRRRLAARGVKCDEPVDDAEATRFREVAIRRRGRMDVRHCDATSSPDDDDGGGRRPRDLPPLPLIDKLARSILHGAEPPRRVYAGWIFSSPGSEDQPWHQDGCPLFESGTETLPCYALNAFCGLHDERLLEIGPTEFIVGSHRMKPDDAMDEVGEAVSAVLGRGDVLLYDYRICHRGTSNLTTPAVSSGVSTEDKAGTDRTPVEDGIVRKVLYLMYARPWFRDHLNFGAKSLFN
ncbi:hypothetical protein ACHAWF_017177 [Thalassiosira exigua]